MEGKAFCKTVLWDNSGLKGILRKLLERNSKVQKPLAQKDHNESVIS